MSTLSLRTRDNMRSTVTKEYIKFERKINRETGIEEVTERRVNLPVGKGWNDGSLLFWENMGLLPAEKYDADQHKKAVEAEQETLAQLEIQKLKAELLALKAQKTVVGKVDFEDDKTEANDGETVELVKRGPGRPTGPVGPHKQSMIKGS